MASFQGVIALIYHNNDESDQVWDKKELFVDEMVCPVCNGTRLKSESLCFRIDDKNIAEVAGMEIDALYEWVCGLHRRLSPRQLIIAEDILKELKDRIGFLKEVGLDYLSLDRTTRSLSGGESQRIRLATPVSYTHLDVYKRQVLNISDNSTIEFGTTKLKVIHTPGHTQGSVCFHYRKQKLLFCGDTLFAGSIGRTDLPGGNFDQLIESITQKLLSLDSATRVMPGHGPETTIGYEYSTNPFLG